MAAAAVADASVSTSDEGRLSLTAQLGYGVGQIARLIDMISDDKVLTVEPHLAIFDGFAQIDGSEMKHKFHFKSNGEAFDAAVNALKALLTAAGYREEKGTVEWQWKRA